MSRTDVWMSMVLSVVVLSLFVMYYNHLFAITFDENFARATGINAPFYNMVLAFLTAVTIVLGMRIMGALLISALIIFPALTSMRLFKHFKSVILSSAIISVICFVLGIMMSYLYATPPGASVVIMNIVLFAAFSLLRTLRRNTKVGA